jgi:NADPH-dependent F420 reductase
MPRTDRPPQDPISVIGGTGKLGPGLAMRLARAGRPVVLGSRDARRARERAAELNARVAAAGGGAAISGTVNAEATAAATIVFLTVPHEAQGALLPELAGPLSGKIVVSTAVAVRFDPELGAVAEEVGEGSSAERVAKLLPGSRVVAGFHTVSSAHLARLDRDLDEDVLLCGDDAAAKSEVIRLTRLVAGLRPVDAGRLGNARLTEELTVLLLNVNRLARRSAGVRLVGI